MSTDRAIPAVDPSLAELGRQLGAAGVRWAVLRGAIDRPGDGDLDLLVHPDDQDAFRSVARAAGFPRLPAWGHGHHRFHLGRGTGGWWRLDAVDTFRFAGGERLDPAVTDAVLARRGGAPVPRLHPEDEAVALIVHLLLDRATRSEGDRRRLAAAADAVEASAPSDGAGGGPLWGRLGALVPDGWGPARLATALAEDDPTIGAIRAGVQRAWRPHGLRARLASWRDRVAQTAAARLRKPLTAIRRSGPSVALMGPDGAGKSALIGALPGGFPLPVRTAYLGLYPVGGDRRGGPKGLGFVRRMGLLWRRYLIARGHRWRGRLVVFDRHPLDARLAPRGRSRMVDRLRRAVLGRALPLPDLILILDAPGEVLHARKDEYPADVLEVDRQRYRALAARIPRAQLVDAARPADVVLDDVIDRIWTVWATRLDGRRGGAETP